MKTYKNLRTKLSLSASLALLVTLVLVSATMAYLTFATEEKVNKFTTGDLETELVEPVYENVAGVLHKEPFVTNVGTGAALVRMTVSVDPEELLADITSAPSSQEAQALWDAGYRLWIDFQNTWELKADGYWYYKGVIEPDEDTAPIFTTVNWLKMDGEKWVDPLAFDVRITKECVFADAVKEDGTVISAENENGTYNAANAAEIWEIYTE